MIDKFISEKSIDLFNKAIIDANNAENFEEGIAHLNSCYEHIANLENLARQMKQEAHDLTQDVYNRFKDKGYVHTINF